MKHFAPPIAVDEIDIEPISGASPDLYTSVDDDLQLLARRARDLAWEWRCGLIEKPDAVDWAFDFALALGLHYRLAGTVEAIRSGDPEAKARALQAMIEQRPIDAIQSVIGAAFEDGA